MNSTCPPVVLLLASSIGAFPAQQCEVDFVAPFGGKQQMNNIDFGASVAAHGGIAVVGAPDALLQGPSSDSTGGAYVLEFDNGAWTSTALLHAETPVTGTDFGEAVATDGSRIAVGDPSLNVDGFSGAGTVTVYELDGADWNLDVTLDSNLENNAHFGEAVAISGTHLLGGAPDHGPTNTGLVTFFERVGGVWTSVAALGETDDQGSMYGFAVAVDGNLAIVGAPGDRADRGSVFAYEWDGSAWSAGVELLAQGIGSGDEYGKSLDLAGNTLIVGAPGDDEVQTDSGAGYAWRRVGGVWTFEQKLLDPISAADDRRGSAVAIEGALAVVGGSEAGTNQGAAAAFGFDGSSWIVKPLTHSPQVGDRFASAAAIAGTSILLGAPRDDTNGDNLGAVIVFNGSEPAPISGVFVAPHDGHRNDAFGFDVDLEGNRAVVGCPSDVGASLSSGSVFHYEKDGGVVRRRPLGRLSRAGELVALRQLGRALRRHARHRSPQLRLGQPLVHGRRLPLRARRPGLEPEPPPRASRP